MGLSWMARTFYGPGHLPYRPRHARPPAAARALCAAARAAAGGLSPMARLYISLLAFGRGI